MSTTLARLKRRLKRLGITQDQVASEAGVQRTLVCNVLAGRDVSANVRAAAERLIEWRRREQEQQEARDPGGVVSAGPGR